MSTSLPARIGKVVLVIVIACIALVSLAIPSLKVVLSFIPKPVGLVAVESFFGT